MILPFVTQCASSYTKHVSKLESRYSGRYARSSECS